MSIGTTASIKTSLLNLVTRPHLSNFEIEFKTKTQPAFNRQFDLLIKDLKEHESERI